MTDTVISCKFCGLAHRVQPLAPGAKARCLRCASTLAHGSSNRLWFCAAFSLSALLLYLPANLFPILRMNLHGVSSDNTVLQGCIRLYQDHDYIVAGIVFMASVLIPILKILALLLLTSTARFGLRRFRKVRMRIFQAIDRIGRWAMLDVFAVAILVSLVKLQGLATIQPGRGLLAFVLVVLFSFLASQNFDPISLWETGQSP